MADQLPTEVTESKAEVLPVAEPVKAAPAPVKERAVTSTAASVSRSRRIGSGDAARMKALARTASVVGRRSVCLRRRQDPAPP